MVKMRFLVFSLLITLLAVPCIQWIAPAQAFAAQPVGPLINLRSSDNEGLVIEFNLPPFQTETDQFDGGGCQRLLLDGWGELGNPGQPAIPFKGELIGLPLDGGARVSVLESGPEKVVENFNLCPVSTPVPEVDLTAAFPEAAEGFMANPAAYTDPDSRPGVWAALGTPSMLRSQRVVQLRLQPFQYQAGAHSLRYISHLVIQVLFDTQPTSGGISSNEGPYESILKNTLLNYNAARPWRVSQFRTAAERSATHPDPSVQLAVSTTGIYMVTFTELLAKGVPIDSPGFDSRSLRLLNNGNETAIAVRGDKLLFYGQQNDTRYTDTNIYWLTWGGAEGLRVAERDGTPGVGTLQSSFLSTIRAEQNLSYRSNYPSGPEQDRWYWDLIVANSVSVSKEYMINLPHVSTSAPPDSTVIVRGLLCGYSASPQHHTRIYFNNILIKDSTWPSQAEFAFETSVPLSEVQEGINKIKIESLLDGGITLDYTLVNWFEVAYQRDYAADSGVASFSGDQAGDLKYLVPGFSSVDAELWDISQPLAPQRIINAAIDGNALVFEQDNPSPRKYLAFEPGNLLSPKSITPIQPIGLYSADNGADYILITHPDFLAAVQPLADYHSAQGMRVKVVNVQDIYNEFGEGTMDPNAIRDFLAYTYNHWAPPAPSFVVLVGDGNYDFKNFMGTNEPNFIPPYLANVDPWMGEVPADNLYVAFDPLNGLPDMALGRLPVKTAVEAASVITRIINYPQNLSDNWNKKILVVADIPDDAGNFSADADAFASKLPTRFTTDKVYLPVGVTTLAVTAARQNILNGVNNGRLIVHYTGHSSAYSWSAKDLFGKQTIPALANLSNLPFVISMTCYVGFYSTPPVAGIDRSGFDEVLVRAANGGAIATWSPTGAGTAPGHAVLDAGFTQAAFHDHMLQIGLSTAQAKYYLYTNSGSYRELIDTYLLMGDPALSLPLDLKFFVPVVKR